MSEPIEAKKSDAQPSPWVEGTTLSAGVLVVLVLYLMVNYLAMRHYERFDATSSQLYTLSEKSKNVVRDLDRDVDIVVLLNPAGELYTAADELLDRYVAVNPERLQRRDLDEAKDMLELQRLVDHYGIDRDNVIIVATEDDQRVIGEFELASYDYSGAQFGQPPALEEFKGEQLITSAILSLIEAEKPKLVFTTGHGEARLDPGDPRALSQAKDLLGKDNFDLEEWSSLGADAVPEGTDLLVIAGPTTNFLPQELALLTDYLNSGGRLLLFLDPSFAPNQPDLVDLGFADWLRGYGIETREDIVIDPSSDLPFFGAETLFTDRYGSHPIVESLKQTGTRVLLPLVRSVGAGSAPKGVELTEIVLTSEAAWGETNLVDLDAVAADEGADLMGPVPVAVAATLTPRGAGASSWDPATAPVAEASEDAVDPGVSEPAASEPQAPDTADPLGAETERPVVDEADKARMVVFGDLDFASDAQIGNGANSVLLLNTFNWLTEREKLIDIEARRPEKTRLAVSGSELYSLYLIVLLLMPGAAIVAGIWIAMQRRR